MISKIHRASTGIWERNELECKSSSSASSRSGSAR